MIKNRLFLVFTILLVTYHTNCQDIVNPTLENFLTSSPSAYELGKYGGIAASKFYGSVSTNIPLFNFKAGAIEVPISLSYSSNGIKVNQIASNVGMGWSLNAGGLITRIVKDMPDEYRNYPILEIPRNPFDLNEETVDFIQGCEFTDSENDVFSYNFFGYSGKFILNDVNNGAPLKFPLTNDKIEYEKIGKNITSFEITTLDGTIYSFGGDGLTETIRSTPYGTGSCTKSFINAPTTWYLKSIETPTGDVVNFNYIEDNYSYVAGISQTAKDLIEANNTTSCDCPNSNSVVETCTTAYNVTGYILQSITSDNHGSVVFTHGTRADVVSAKMFEEFNVYSENGKPIKKIDFKYNNINGSSGDPLSIRLYLNGVDLYQVNGTEPLSYVFSYNNPEALPGRLSFAIDHYSLYNGKTTNSNLLPLNNEPSFKDVADGDRTPNFIYASKGILTKIKYPTGGTQEFIVEANKIKKRICTPSEEEQQHTYSVIGIDLKTTNELTGSFGSDKVYNIQFRSLFNTDCDPDNDAWCIKIEDLRYQTAKLYIYSPSGSLIYQTANLPVGQSVDLNFSVESGSTWKIAANGLRCKAVLNYISVTSDLNCYDQLVDAGGLRLQKVINKESPSATSEVRRYYYNTFESKNNPAFMENRKLNYFSYSEIKNSCSTKINECLYYTLSSSSNAASSNFSGSSFNFPIVTESFGENFENGGITTTYTCFADTPGNLVFGEQYPNYQPTGNQSDFNGKILTEIYFKVADGIKLLQKKIENTYDNHPNYHKTYKNYSINKLYDYIATWDVVYPCNADNIKDSTPYFDCSNLPPGGTWTTWNFFGDKEYNAKVYWEWNGLSAVGTKIKCDTKYLKHPCVGHEVGETVVRPKYMNNMTVFEYEYESEFNYLKEKMETMYSESGQFLTSTKTEYVYSDEEPIQLKQVISTNSKGETVTKYLYYPSDEPTENYNAELLLNNIESPVVLSAILTNGKLTSGNKVELNKQGQLLNSYIHSEDYPTVTDAVTTPVNINFKFDIYQELSYYTLSNKLRTYKDRTGLEYILVWGYDDVYPVAKIENMTFDAYSLNTSLIDFIDALDTYSTITDANRTSFRSTNSNIRNHMPTQSRITTYTYDPLIGMTSETDTNGKTTYYEYDNYGRVQYIKDDEGKVLQRYEYNYAK